MIERPNNIGLSCKVVQNGLELEGINNNHIPNHPNYRLGPLEGSGCDTLGIEKAIYILANPYPFEACVGGAAHFEVTAFGTGRSYYWQSSTDGGETWQTLSDGGHFSDTQTEYLLLNDIPASFDNMQFRCIVEGNISVDTTRAATLTLIGELPVAGFNFTQDKDSLFFENLSTGAEYVTWNFADGDSSTLENPTHLFESPGTFLVRVVATNACGQDTAVHDVTIDSLWADFTADRTFGCAPLQVRYEDLSPYRATAVNFITYKDGAFYANGPMPTLNDTGTYEVRQFIYAPSETASMIKEDYITVVEGINPVSDIELTQNGTLLNLNAPFGLADEYVWYFADGDTLTGQTVEYEIESPGIYEVQLATTNHCGTEVGSIEVLVGELEAALSSEQTSGCAPLTVNFENETAFANADFVWHFPGGQPGVSQEMSPEVSYPQPGVYDVRLIVWADSLGDTLLLENYIEAFPDDCPQPGLTTSLDGHVLTAWTSCPDDLNFNWSMGNGAELTTPAIAYEYPEVGEYEVVVVVEGVCGNDTLTTVVEIEPSSSNEKFSEKHIHLAPNPAGDYVMVVSEKKWNGAARFELFSLLGSEVLSIKKEAWGQSEKVPLGGLASGVYIYRFRSEAGHEVGRLVVER